MIPGFLFDKYSVYWYYHHSLPHPSQKGIIYLHKFTKSTFVDPRCESTHYFNTIYYFKTFKDEQEITIQVREVFSHYLNEIQQFIIISHIMIQAHLYKK